MVSFFVSSLSSSGRPILTQNYQRNTIYRKICERPRYQLQLGTLEEGPTLHLTLEGMREEVLQTIEQWFSSRVSRRVKCPQNHRTSVGQQHPIF